jgi:hypothetical protein
MATKSDFTPDEWNQLLKAPGWASIVVVAASPSGPFGVVKEMFAAGKLIAETKQQQSGKNALLDALVTDLMSSEGRRQAQPTEIVGKSPEEVRRMALDALKQCVALVDRKGGADAAALKTWLSTLADRVAVAAKEGGFLGIGGTPISEQEKTALADLKRTLGATV